MAGETWIFRADATGAGHWPRLIVETTLPRPVVTKMKSIISKWPITAANSVPSRLSAPQRSTMFPGGQKRREHFELVVNHSASRAVASQNCPRTR
jgi:hypothetical protein